MDRPIETSRQSVRRRWILRVFLVGAILSGVGFAVKIFEFLQDLLNSNGLHFAGAHLAVYAFVAGGFLLLLTYGFLKGHFSDIEKPKFDMLEREITNDRQEFGRS